jgi:hypothetical protein
VTYSPPFAILFSSLITSSSVKPAAKTVRTLDRKIAGQHAITKADALAVDHVVECLKS